MACGDVRMLLVFLCKCISIWHARLACTPTYQGDSWQHVGLGQPTCQALVESVAPA